MDKRRYERFSRYPLVRVALVSGLSGMISSTTMAQSTSNGQRLNPSHTRSSRDSLQRYNLKWGDLLARLRASVQMEASDNIALSDDNPEADLGFGPRVDVGLFWPITQANLLQMDLGLGYRYYLDHPAIQSLEITPETHLDYQILFPQGLLTFRDSFSIEVDPTSRPDLSGNVNNVEEYRRFQNLAGFTLEWTPVQDLSLVVGYDFALDRSISGEFTSLDRNSHQIGLGGYYRLEIPATLGLRTTFSSSHFLRKVHNDSRTYGFGPVLFLQPSEFITLDASVGYSLSTFDSSGTVTDRSEFQGVTGQLGIRHQLNRRISHELTFGKSFQLGLGNNFYELLALRYSLHLPLGPKLDLSPAFTYEHYRNSSTITETADRYLFQLRSSWRFGRRWSVGAAYSFTTKDSNLTGRDYSQNRLTIDLTRQF